MSALALSAHLYDMNDFDSSGYSTARVDLTCPHCGRGEVTPIREYPGGYAEAEWTGSECSACLAEWEPDGTARRGPHRAFFDHEAQVKAFNDSIGAAPQAEHVIDLGETQAGVNFDTAFAVAQQARNTFKTDAATFVFNGTPVRVDAFTSASEAFEAFTDASQGLR